jgi:hypothetical protein
VQQPCRLQEEGAGERAASIVGVSAEHRDHLRHGLVVRVEEGLKTHRLRPSERLLRRRKRHKRVGAVPFIDLRLGVPGCRAFGWSARRGSGIGVTRRVRWIGRFFEHVFESTIEVRQSNP